MTAHWERHKTLKDASMGTTNFFLSVIAYELVVVVLLLVIVAVKA